MTTLVACPVLPQRSSPSLRAMTIFATVAAMSFSAAGAAPTPLYHAYQEAFGLTPVTVTTIFAAYAFSLLGALLTAGTLSDHLGRRPTIAVALLLNMLAMGLFMAAHSAGMLIAARSVQGFATGIATATLGATILDTDRVKGPVLNSLTAFVGLSVGNVVSGLLVTYAPDPMRLIYVVLLGLSIAEAIVLLTMPETARRRPGALASLRPHIHVPPQARRALALVTPANVAFWALGGFYFSLMPTLVRLATGLEQPFVGGFVVAAFTGSGSASVFALRKHPPARLLTGGIVSLVVGVSLTLAGVAATSAVFMIAGTVIAGAGFGAAFSGAMRLVVPLAQPQERAGLLSAFYVESYLAFATPALLLGLLAPEVGLTRAAYGYGAAVIGLALASLVFCAMPFSARIAGRSNAFVSSRSTICRQ
jgi:hypothetical protein